MTLWDSLDDSRQQQLTFVLPGIVSSLIVWLVFLIIGETPLFRATGLALVVMGITLTLRQWGNIQCIIGGLALAFSPAFWSQATISATDSPATIVIALIIGVAAISGVLLLSRRPYVAISAGIAIFAVILLSEIGSPRSLRLTSLLAAWLLFFLVDSIRISNPRPDEPSPVPVDTQRTTVMMLIFAVGTLNDPLFVLLAPALAMGLWLCRAPLSIWYWLALLAMTLIGVRGLIITYADSSWWLTAAYDAHQNGVTVPYLIADGWRQGVRWVDLLALLQEQFTIVGLGLTVFGLARMARWYPLLGVISMIAFGSYWVFGLMYFGADRDTLLLPLFIIQIIWLTYAIHAIGQWVDRSFSPQKRIAHRAVTITYVLLPTYLLITNGT